MFTVTRLLAAKVREVYELREVLDGPPIAIYFKAKMDVCADGAPNAYHPDDQSGLDELKYAGHPGNWWALVTDNGRPSGTPLIQKASDPCPGFYYSMTAMSDPRSRPTDPGCFVDARSIPYVVLKAGDLHGAKLGDLCLVLNTENNHYVGAIFADTGPDVGEGSIALANLLGVPADPRNGGEKRDLFAYFVLMNCQLKWPISANDIQTEVLDAIAERGGIAVFQDVASRYP